MQYVLAITNLRGQALSRPSRRQRCKVWAKHGLLSGRGIQLIRQGRTVQLIVAAVLVITGLVSEVRHEGEDFDLVGCIVSHNAEKWPFDLLGGHDRAGLEVNAVSCLWTMETTAVMNMEITDKMGSDTEEGSHVCKGREINCWTNSRALKKQQFEGGFDT